MKYNHLNKVQHELYVHYIGYIQAKNGCSKLVPLNLPKAPTTTALQATDQTEASGMASGNMYCNIARRKSKLF